MLGRVGRDRHTEVKFLSRTARWHEQEMCFSWSGGTRYVTELAVLLGLTDIRDVTKTRTPETKATGGGTRDALQPLEVFQAATFRSAVGLIGYIVLDRLDGQYAASGKMVYRQVQYSSLGEGAAVVSLGAVDMEEGVQVRVQVVEEKR